MDHVQIFDTTLRDGEQSPGASMDVEQKFEIALQLEHLGVDVIEAGFPVSSPEQFRACRLIADRVKDSTIAALTRSNEKDIDAAADALVNAAHSRIHTFVSTSPVHMQYKLKKTPDEVLEMTRRSVRYARSKAAEVEFSPEDATRTDIDFLCRVLDIAIEEGATILNIPDTVGYTVPSEYANLITTIRNRVSNIDKAIISVHCHDDLGLAVANTVSAIDAGARQAEVTINGIGERAGNAALEEVVMALKVRKDAFNVDTRIDTRQLYSTSRMVSTMIGFPIPRNKAVVGENAFSHEAGIHQHGMLSHRETYEIMTPESVGRDATRIVLGRHSGMHGFRKRLAELGIVIEEEEIKKAYDAFLKVADRKKEVFDEDLYTILSEQFGSTADSLVLEYVNFQSGNTSIPTATVRIRDHEEVYEEAATGDGPVDAVFRAIERACGTDATLIEYNVQAVTPGKQAIGETSVVIEIDGKRSTGRGSSTDILEASAKAYVNALSRHRLLKEVTHP
ncbi:MAG: 2-isopropylmalate synthase [Alkalispirochaeta sp.]